MIHAEEILKVKRVINKLYVKHTGQTAEEIGNQLFFLFSYIKIRVFYYRKIT
jgi:hypothetical protein